MIRKADGDVQSLSTAAVGRLLGVSLGSVANWIDAGKLKAGRTPGGHRRVAADDLLYFLRRHGLPVPEALAPSAPRILVVDDEESVARWIAEEIRYAHPDYEVQMAHDGFSAGDLVGSWKPDVVFLDLRMPGMDGYEVCRRIKAKPETERVRVIAITAHYSAKTVTEIMNCGAVLCLPKPLKVDLLLVVLEAALHGGDNEQAHLELLAAESPLSIGD